MSPHRVTIELSDEDFGLLRKKVDSGHYNSESEVLADLIPELPLERSADPAYERWIEESLLPAYDEAEAHPESLLSEEQLLQRAPKAEKTSADAAYWLQEEVAAAEAESEAHPESLMSGEQLLEYLKQQRDRRTSGTFKAAASRPHGSGSGHCDGAMLTPPVCVP